MKPNPKNHKGLFFLWAVSMLFFSSCTSEIETLHLEEITYQMFEGEWKNLPDFSKLDPVAEGTLDEISLDWIGEKENFAVVFWSSFFLKEMDDLELRLHTDRQCRVFINGDLVFDKSGWDKNFRKSFRMEKGAYQLRVEYLHTKGDKILEFDILPSVLEVPVDRLDNRHWTYFGWKEDHPKAVSLMGGALYPRRPKMPSGDDHSWDYSREAWHPEASEVILFLLSVDGSEPFYPFEKKPDRREKILWHLAEGYLPSPVSEWEYQGVKVQIQHVGKRILDNSVNAVYTKLSLSNESEIPKEVNLLLNGKEVAFRSFLTSEKGKLKKESKHLLSLSSVLAPGNSESFEFVSPANGSAPLKEILSAGSFTEQYTAGKSELDKLLSSITHPVELPDPRLVDLWNSSIPYMHHAIVATPEDYEQRGSGGNPYGFYQYDRVFDHDVPNMVIQFILEGQWEIAKKIMQGATYDRLSQGLLEKEKYMDAVPKYLITMAQYLQTSGDTAFFDTQLKDKIKRCAHIIHEFREPQLKDELKGYGAYGLIKKGSTLDNWEGNHLVVDNFAALHGLVSYEYICHTLHDAEEAKWARDEMIHLNTCLNQALEISMKEKNSDWYNACFSFDWIEPLLAGPGNWFGTTLMMSTFPWGAHLKGYDLGGAWKDHFDPSVEKGIRQSLESGNPEGSFGAWWGAKYGAAYNAGMGLQLLYSDAHRTKVAQSINWLLENQSAPYNWGENFHPPSTPGDWNPPETDYETWALGYIRQALLQLCVSVTADGAVIIGRGIPEEWMEKGGKVSWNNVLINGGKRMNLRIWKAENTIHLTFEGDSPDGFYVINLPELVSKIGSVEVDQGRILERNDGEGKITLSSETKGVSILLEKK